MRALPLARRLARFSLACSGSEARTTGKVITCLHDALAGALLSRDLPWSRQAVAYAHAMGGSGATLIGHARGASPADCAFANGTMAHGLVQEDMHAGAVSHIGVVVLPTLLALAEAGAAGNASDAAVSGRGFVNATVAGYQVMGRLGRALVTRETAQTFRPTGMIGAIAGAAAGAALLRLDEDAATSAIALAANTLSGLNEWPRTGGSEMYFQPGFAARNAVTAVLIARAGARCSESALDGQGGLIRAFRAPAEAVAGHLENLLGAMEIHEVYHKPAPACNYAQTPAQAALDVARRLGDRAAAVRAVRVKSFPEAVQYPGCDWAGPFATVLQAKMSIQFAVGTALVHGALDEASFRTLDDPRVLRLARLVTFEADAAFAAGFPAHQGAEVIVDLADGSTLSARYDDVVPLDPPAVRARFLGAAEAALGARRAAQAAATIDELLHLADLRDLMRHLVPGD